MSSDRRRKLLPLLAVVPLVTAFGCSSNRTASTATTRAKTTTSATASTTGFPVTIHAANGAVTMKARPKAIVSLSPTATEMLYAIGAGPQVKAVDEYSDYPPSAPMSKLDGLDPNVEAIASYKPDLVLVSDDTASLNKQLGALGIPVLYLPAATNLAQDYQQYIEIGEATGHVAEAAAEVTAIKASLARIIKSVPKPAHPESYYYEVGIDPYYSVTDSTFVGKLLGLLGLHSVADAAKGAAASGGYPELNAEFILQSNPDYIFLADTICCHQSATTVAHRPGWSLLSAVKDHRLLGLNDDIASRWGPRIVMLLKDVATELKQHPLAGS
ncbi:MAG TPA: ABC transporter substrate-binding protein [Acidimicrobiales bacterium]|nr:ABC transporter substrate-binding protein [Acidimicrobiales bacterium]